jgi:bifunctional DNase/RNase
MEKVKLEIVGLTSGHSQKGTYTILLAEEGRETKLPIVIGAFEAQSIAIVMEDIKPQRPLTHDLFVSLAEEFKIVVVEVLIDNLIEGVFFAKLVCEQDNKHYLMDARSSDAIALAVRFKCPIYTTRKIMEEAGIVMEDSEDESPDRPLIEELEPTIVPEKSNFSNLDLEELERMLDDAIQVEDYDKAAMIRDELKRRK